MEKGKEKDISSEFFRDMLFRGTFVKPLGISLEKLKEVQEKYPDCLVLPKNGYFEIIHNLIY